MSIAETLQRRFSPLEVLGVTPIECKRRSPKGDFLREELHVLVLLDSEKPQVVVHPGVTGHECYRVSRLREALSASSSEFKPRPAKFGGMTRWENQSFGLCAGGMGWDGLFTTYGQMQEALEYLLSPHSEASP